MDRDDQQWMRWFLTIQSAAACDAFFGTHHGRHIPFVFVAAAEE
jgi:hypothetical protein